MTVEERLRGDVTVLDITGRLVLGDDDGKVRYVVRYLLSLGRRQFVINMAGVTDLDSCGIGELAASYVSVVNQGGQMRFVNLGRYTDKLLNISRLLTIFDVFHSEDEAVASFISLA
jgi:anti-anti-sigma factor